MKIALGNDHCGYALKTEVKAILGSLGIDVIDFGCHSAEPVDFPDITRQVCDAVRTGKADRGLLVCGTGVGASIAANKMPGIRAAVCHDVHCAHQGVEHDDMNVMCLGAQIIGAWLARDLIAAYVQARFIASEDYRRRVGKIHALELAAARELKDQV